jgi:ribosomal protein S27E
MLRPLGLCNARYPRRVAKRMDTDTGSGGSREAQETPSSGLQRPNCPGCGEPWLRPAQLPGRFVCVYCLRRFELVSQCPNCGEHQTISRMSRTEDMKCQHCGHSMLRTI